MRSTGDEGRSKKKTASGKAAKPARTAKVVASKAETKANASLVSRTIVLIETHRLAEAKGRRAIGEHVLDEYFGGDVALVKSKSPTKAKSYALLAKRADDEAGWDERDLRDAVSMAIAYRSLAKDTRDAVAATYLLRLASVDDLKRRRELAAQITSGALSGGEVLAAIAAAGESERGGGRARAPSAVRAVGSLVRAAERAEEAGALTVRSLRSLDHAARSELAKTLRALVKRLTEIAKRAEKS